MSNGLISLIGANGTSTAITVSRPGGHSTTDTITIAAPPSLDHMDYTLSSSSATVGGTAPTGTVTKWQDAGETTPFTGSVSLSYTSSNTAVATINSSTGVITLVAAGSCTFRVTDSVSTKTATTGTLTVSPALTAPGAPTASNATAQTSSSLTFPVTLNASGDLPSALAWRYSTDNATWTNGSDITLTSPSLGQNLTETVSVPSASTLYYVQFAEKNTAGTSSYCASVTGTTSAAPSYAYALTAPSSNALVADWPGNDYASSAAFQSNANSKYAANPGTNCTLDTGVQVGGKPTLKIDRSSSDGNLKLIIPSGATKTDIIYHLRRRTESALANDTWPALTYANWRTSGNGSMCVLAGLSFDPASYGYSISDYYANGVPIGFIGLMLDYSGTVGNFPMYRLFASVANTSLTVLSDSTSQRGVVLSYIGDEMFANADADYHFEVAQGTQAGTGYPCLNIDCWLGAPGAQPKRLTTSPLVLTMGGTTPPMPTHALSFVKEPAMTPTPKVSRLIFHQVFDNVAHPNAAFDPTVPGTITKYQGGLGTHGTGIGARDVDLTLYTDNTDFTNKIDDVLAGTNGSASRIQRYGASNISFVNAAGSDAAHGNLPYIRNTQLAGGARSSGRIFSNFQNRTQRYWRQASVLFSSGWTGFGAGLQFGTLTNPVTASASLQTVSFTPAGSDSGADLTNRWLTAGFGTANFENIGHMGSGGATFDNVNHTVTAIFSKNHAAGEDVAYGPGPDYKILQTDISINGATQVARLEIVFGQYESYFSSVSADGTYPMFTDLGCVTPSGFNLQGVGIFRETAPTHGTVADCFSIPTIHDNDPTAYPARLGPLAGQTIELKLTEFVLMEYDADYGRYRMRVLHAIGLPGSAPAICQFAEAWTTYTASDDLYLKDAHYGENLNDRPQVNQTIDWWNIKERDARLTDDPFGVLSAAGMALPGVATLGSPTATTTTLTYPVTAPASGATILNVVPEVFNGTYWVPNTNTPPTWSAGMGGTQNVTVTGLTTGTNYSNKIRFRLVSALGMGNPVVATTGTTS